MSPSMLMRDPLARYSDAHGTGDRQPLPVTLIGGFLGAGKTTLLNSLLMQGEGRRIAVLVNDFGDLNIDAQLIVKVEGQTVELANGCICCSIRDDLIAGVTQLLNAEPRPEHLLIETSGVSDPENILCTFNQSPVRRDIFLENVVTVVDALHALDARDTEYAALFQRQVGGAYMVVINRAAAAGAAQVQAVRAMIETLRPGIALVEADDGAVPLAVLLGASRQGQALFRPEPTMDSRAHPFTSMVWSSERPVRRSDFNRTLHALSHTVYRAKGFINFQHYPLATLYQKVGGQASCIDGGAWRGATPRSELVLIGLASGLDPAEIGRQLDACCVG
ncbi:GTP-binding protein [Flagellatimonas centrodinii]|uniref:CobW family GTP-binding protein n=1 Tax=Flagellatimonas centrodinii TaxID=2806210 RepID=UPI001FEF771E|nr:GTP-binding protein [Flagellatimonas centrodinii]ULQ45293.1 GTP-binding protein [Flagellatimonas centrodinii]